MSGSRPVRWAAMVAGSVAASACAPVFSDLQSARTLPPGKVELTPQATSTSFRDDDESEHVQDHLGAQVAVGVAERVELRGRYERILVDDSGGGQDGVHANVVGFGPKVALVRDRVSLYVPVGLAFGNDIESRETLTLQPTVLASFPAGNYVEINTSAKANLPLDDEGDMFRGFGVNLGLGLGPRGGAWSIRPEAGVLFAKDDVKYLHASIGVSLRPR